MNRRRRSGKGESHFLLAGRKLTLGGRSYVVQRWIKRGGSGDVYEVQWGERRFALKLFFPFFQIPFLTSQPTPALVSISEAIEFQRREYRFLSQLSHPNIVRVYDADDVHLTATEQGRLPGVRADSLPAIVTDLVDGEELGKAIEAFNFSAEHITNALLRIARALEYLHAHRRYLHMDIKPANILIRRLDREPILIDFALCKNLNFDEVKSSETTRLVGDWGLFPKLPTDHRLLKIKETEGSREEIARLGFPGLDLLQVGKLLQELRPVWLGRFESAEMSYLDILAAHLTDWERVSRWGPSDLTPYLERLSARGAAVFGVPELTAPTVPERTLTVPPGVGIPITRRIEQIIETRSFRRLGLIRQLCLLSYVYPGADYKRSVHVLFAYDLARQFATHLYGSSQFRFLFDQKSTQQLLVTALLHDINHFPFLHIFQESGISALDRLEIVDLFCDGEATGESAARQPSIYDLLQEIGIDRERFKRLLFAAHREQVGETREVDHVISSLINSGVDIDKLSYLHLDAYFTGVRYGAGIDYPCILKAATLANVGEAGALHLAFTDRALQAVENVIMTRYWNFRSLYWHHTNRAIMAMILYSVRRLYVERKADVREYLVRTMWAGDFGALRYIDERFRDQFGKDSILSGMIEDRGRLYKRLYTVRAGQRDDADNEIFTECRSLDQAAEMRLCACLAGRLSEFLSRPGAAEVVREEEVLVDIPRRAMDTGGAVYIALGRGRGVPIEDMSEPVRAIERNYDRLAKRMRFFVSPRVAELLRKDRRIEERKLIQEMVKESLREARGRSQVK